MAYILLLFMVADALTGNFLLYVALWIAGGFLVERLGWVIGGVAALFLAPLLLISSIFYRKDGDNVPRIK